MMTKNIVFVSRVKSSFFFFFFSVDDLAPNNETLILGAHMDADVLIKTHER
jgi:hypothetical protein